MLTEQQLRQLYRRAPQLDKRIRSGDDFAADAWENINTGEIKHTAVGQTPTPGSFEAAVNAQ